MTTSSEARSGIDGAASTLRIAVHDFSGHPFQLELSRALAEKGHQVLHLYCEDYVSGRGAVRRTDTDPASLEIRAVGMGSSWDRYSPWKRVRQELTYAVRAWAELEDYRPDALVTCNVPLFAAMRLRRKVNASGLRQVYWLQDLYSVGIGSSVWDRSRFLGRLASPVLSEMEATLLRESVGVVAITEDFLPVLATWHVDASRVRVLPNWAPITELPVVDRSNAWAREHGYVDRPVVLYAGTLGLKHDSDLLFHLAGRLAVEEPSAKVVVISEGPAASRLSSEVDRAHLDNLDVHGFQSWEEMPSVLGSADVLLVMLNEAAGAFSVPSKVATYLCAARPIVASVPANNLSARVLASTGAGKVVPTGDADNLAAVVIGLLRDASERSDMGQRGRNYAERAFDVRRAADVFEELLAPERGGR